jgi:hypothetical protein
MSNLPVTLPAETLAISPEALEISNSYLQTQDINKTSEDLGVPVEIVTNYLGRREVRQYIDNVFMNLGFNNRFRMRNAMDAILAKKFQELDEADVGSSKDIADLLALSHKMSMDELDRQIQLKKLESDKPKTQTNIQINNDGSNYGSLIEKLINNQLS